MITDEQESDGLFIPLEQDASGQVDTKFPDRSPHFFYSKTHGEISGIKGPDECINIPLNFHALRRTAAPKDSFEPPTEEVPQSKAPEMLEECAGVLKFLGSLASLRIGRHSLDLAIREPRGIGTVDGLSDELRIALPGLSSLSAEGQNLFLF